MANPKTIHVLKRGYYWVVKKPNSARASGEYDTQKEAYLAARKIALNQGLSITVHGPDGRIQKVVYPQDRASEDGCFITTACVKSMGLPDDCYELKILRRFRDKYVGNLANGKSVIERYYFLAPQIIKAINKRKDRSRVYDSIYIKISQACTLIEMGQEKRAFRLYSDTVKELSLRFGLTK